MGVPTATALTFRSDAASAQLELHRKLLARFLGVRIESPQSDAAPDIYHGNDTSLACRVRIPIVIGGYSDAPPGLPDATRAIEVNAPFPFDLFAALSFWLTDAGNAAAAKSAFDRHGRLCVEASIQQRLNVVDTPIVNAYLTHFKEALERRGLPTPGCFARGKRALILLSHDVDDPIDPNLAHTMRCFANGLGWSARFAKERAWRSSVSFVRSTLRQTGKRIRQRGARRWLFSNVLREEAARGLRSTFFFAARSTYSQGASCFDVNYDVESDAFAPVMREIRDAGAEVGLHISYNAWRHADAIAAERQTLERVSDGRVIGSRHHFWHMAQPFWDTLNNHGLAGLHYDASTAFNEIPGFRLGAAFPFYPWNPQIDAPIATLQLPTVAMDSALFGQAHREVDATVRRMSELIEILKRYQGVASIDWHVRTSYPGSNEYAGMGQSYLEILDLLAADPELEVARCEDAQRLFADPGDTPGA